MPACVSVLLSDMVQEGRDECVQALNVPIVSACSTSCAGPLPPGAGLVVCTHGTKDRFDGLSRCISNAACCTVPCSTQGKCS